MVTNDIFRDVCRRNNWKCTAQRREVFNLLQGNKTHPTAEDIWLDARKSLPDVSLDSVYRILRDFADAGLVQRLESGSIRRFDPDTHPHDHFQCTVCGRVFDFQFLDVSRVLSACAEFGDVSSVELLAKGTCRECQKTAMAE